MATRITRREVILGAAAGVFASYMPWAGAAAGWKRYGEVVVVAMGSI